MTPETLAAKLMQNHPQADIIELIKTQGIKLKSSDKLQEIIAIHKSDSGYTITFNDTQDTPITLKKQNLAFALGYILLHHYSTPITLSTSDMNQPQYHNIHQFITKLTQNKKAP